MSAQFEDNTIVALVVDDYQSDEAKDLVISYTKGTKMVRKVK